MAAKIDEQTTAPAKWLVAGIISTVGFTLVVAKAFFEIQRDLDVLKTEMRAASRSAWTQRDMQLWSANMHIANPELKIIDPRSVLINTPSDQIP